MVNCVSCGKRLFWADSRNARRMNGECRACTAESQQEDNLNVIKIDFDDLEDELADLKAEFEKLMANDDEAEDDADDAMDAAADADADEIEFDAQEMESVEYDLDENFEDSLEEATKLSDNVADPKAPTSDNDASPFTQAPKETKVEGAGKPVHSKDGGEGDHGDSANANPQDPGNHNIDVEQKQQ